MNSTADGWAGRAVRWWVCLYTRGLPADIRDRRRSEIQSDLWEQQCDGDRAGESNREMAWVAVHRLVRGMPADLVWRAGTGDTLAQSLGFWFALSAIIGLWLAFLSPGVPDLDAPTPALAAFYAGKGISIAIGHVLIWISAGTFIWFVLRLYRYAESREEGLQALPALVLVSGILAAAILCLAFALTGIASFYGGAGLDPSVTQRLFPVAGFVFHVVMSRAITVFLAATTAVTFQTKFVSRRTAWASFILALLFLMEAIGSSPVFLLPQALFLVWTVVMSATICRESWATQ